MPVEVIEKPPWATAVSFIQQALFNSSLKSFLIETFSRGGPVNQRDTFNLFFRRDFTAIRLDPGRAGASGPENEKKQD